MADSSGLLTHNVGCSKQTRVQFLSHDELVATSAFTNYRNEVRTHEKFFPAIARIVREHPGSGDVVIVTHREGIRHLVSGRLHTPYCVSAEFMVDVKELDFKLVNTHVIPSLRRKGVKRGKRKGSARSKPERAVVKERSRSASGRAQKRSLGSRVMSCMS